MRDAPWAAQTDADSTPGDRCAARYPMSTVRREQSSAGRGSNRQRSAAPHSSVAAEEPQDDFSALPLKLGPTFGPQRKGTSLLQGPRALRARGTTRGSPARPGSAPPGPAPPQPAPPGPTSPGKRPAGQPWGPTHLDPAPQNREGSPRPGRAAPPAYLPTGSSPAPPPPVTSAGPSAPAIWRPLPAGSPAPPRGARREARPPIRINTGSTSGRCYDNGAACSDPRGLGGERARPPRPVPLLIVPLPGCVYNEH